MFNDWESEDSCVWHMLICNDMFQTLLPYAFFDLATQSSAQLYLNILHPGPSQ